MAITYVEVPRYSATVPIGEIISTDPPSGPGSDPIPEDTVVTLYVSLGPAAANRWTGVNSEAVAAAVAPPVAGSSEIAPASTGVAMVSTFVHLDFVADPLYANDSLVTVPWNGQDWLGLGFVGSIEPIGESLELIAQPVRMTISGVDPSLVSEAMASVYHGRDVTIYKAVFDPYTLDLLDDPEELWSGFMDVMYIEIKQNLGMIRVDCEHWMRRQPRSSRWTDEDQRSRFAGDVGFNRIQYIPGTIAHWGARETGFAGGGGGGRGRTIRQKH